MRSFSGHDPFLRAPSHPAKPRVIRSGKSSSSASSSSSATSSSSTSSSSSGGAVEDDGADCTVTGLPDSASLTTNAKLPDPFKKLDGTRMTTKAEWRCRREEIRKLAEKFALGTKPPKAATVTGTVTNAKISVTVTDKGKTGTFSATVTLPTGGKAPYPVIISLGPAPLDSGVINSEGVAIINFNPPDVGGSGGRGATQGGAFYSIYSGGSATAGQLVAWAWGVSRMIDVIAASDGSILKADAVGVTGCSLNGKGAFISGVLDQRVALTLPIESGTDGVPIWRGIAKAEVGAN